MTRNTLKSFLTILLVATLNLGLGCKGKSASADEAAAAAAAAAGGGGSGADAETNSSLTTDGTWVTAVTEYYADRYSDEGVDGKYDRIETYTFKDQYWYGADYGWYDNYLTYTADSDADGVTDYVYSYSYNTDGTAASQNHSIDGVAHSTTLYTYDDGYLIKEARVDVDDGQEFLVYTFTYDDQGHKLTENLAITSDSAPYYTWTATYDSQGNMLTEQANEDRYYGIDEPYIKNYTYDARGNTLTESYDSNGDGTWDEIDTMTYDATNNLLTKITSFVSAGWSAIYTYTYDTNNNRITETGMSQNSDGETSPYTSYKWEYDSHHNITKGYRTSNPSDSTSYYLYTETTYDSAGNKLTTTDYNSTGTITAQNVCTLDKYGHKLTDAAWEYDGNQIIFEYIKNIIYTYSDGLVTAAADADGDGSPAGIDCDDANAAKKLGGVEVTDGLDNDCNNLIDDITVTYTYYKDDDTDTYGDPAVTTTNETGTTPAGYVTNASDCDDGDAAITTGSLYYVDSDGDGYGDLNATGVSACTTPVGSVTDNTDCNDAESTTHPGAPDCRSVSGGRDFIDNDCDGLVDKDAC